MLSSRNNGPLTPEGSTGRKSQGTRDSVTSRAVGGPPYSTTLRRPWRVPEAPGGTESFTTHTPFHAKPGSSRKSRDAMVAFDQASSVYRKLGNCEHIPGGADGL